MTARRLAQVLVATLLGVAAGTLSPGAAHAAGGYCAKGSGVTVVVDRGALGGGTSIGCDGHGANTAGSTVVPRAGFSLTYVQRQPGFVCRVGGAPASASCGNTPPGDAYWGLFWSDGKSGSWSYSSVGIDSLKVPAGGFIGWRWQNSNARTNPGRAPVSPVAASPRPTPKPAPQPAPKPAPKPTPAPSRSASPSAGATSPGSSAVSRTTTPTAQKRVARAKATRAAQVRSAKQKNQAKAEKKAQATTSASASAAASSSGDPSASPGTRLTAGEPATHGSGPMLPVVAAALLVLLLGAAGRLLWVRRKG
jgi:hypothetical protein